LSATSRARASTPAGWARCAWKCPTDGRFSLGSGLSDASAPRPAAGGTLVTYRYRELTTGGMPRFPSYLRVRDNP
jgi:DNA ligase-1